jgi:hypothetical protein
MPVRVAALVSLTSRASLSAALVALTGLAGCLEDSGTTIADDSEALRIDPRIVPALPTAPELVPLAQAAAVVGLDLVCPPARVDDLCIALRAGDDAGARAAAARRLAGTDRVSGQADPAVRYYLRERQVALLVWNALTERGHLAPPADYAAAATAFLDEHYPAYRGDSSQLAMARRPMPPLDATTCHHREALVYFPGVLRIEDRTEFLPQAAALREAVPCLETIVIDTEDFMDPAVNAAVARRQIDALAGAPALHLIGYSQGVRNLLQTLVTYPDLAARAESVLTLNSAAHGSHAIDVLFLALEALERGGDVCTAVPDHARATCQRLAASSEQPAQVLLGFVSAVLGVPAEQIVDGVSSVDPTLTIAAVREYLRGHLAGWRSLTTFDSSDFWAAHGAQLPRNILYTAFRTTISRPDRNLPLSNAPLHVILNQAGGAEPYNDMQVLLRTHTLGGPVADTEVILPVAEGNHWQWEFLPGQLDSALISSEMLERVPQLALVVSYGQLLFEAGLVE